MSGTHELAPRARQAIRGRRRAGPSDCYSYSRPGRLPLLLAATGIALAASACGNPPTTPRGSVTGMWMLPNFTFNLTQSGGNVGGLLVCTNAVVCGAATDGTPVHGSIAGSALRMSFELPGGASSFAGTMNSDQAVPGILTVGAVSAADTLRRLSTAALLRSERSPSAAAGPRP